MKVLDLFSGIGAFSCMEESAYAGISVCMSNKYTYSVPFTADELFRDYITDGLTQDEIAAKWGVSQKVVWRAMHRAGIKSRKAACFKRMEQANGWRGGIITLQPAKRVGAFVQGRGYRMVYRPGHPNAQKNGYVMEHTLVAMEKLGIERIPDGECVHHINLRKDDNDPANLEVCNHSVHQLYHTQLEELAVRLLLDTGLIKFTPGVGYVEA